jgi:NAD(P)-dependent dehydrogenase (short-subunit alcohol dehydrogenase family)
MLSDKKKLRRVIATMALPQIARPDDMAGTAVFLSSDTLARHITGQAVVIAGGMEGRQLWAPEEVDTALV